MKLLAQLRFTCRDLNTLFQQTCLFDIGMNVVSYIRMSLSCQGEQQHILPFSLRHFSGRNLLTCKGRRNIPWFTRHKVNGWPAIQNNTQLVFFSNWDHGSHTTGSQCLSVRSHSASLFAPLSRFNQCLKHLREKLELLLRK